MIDIEALRSDLIDYYGSAMTIYPAAVIELIDVKNASDDKLIEIANKNNIDLNNYTYNVKRKKI